jgi:hypothetical protein
MPVCLLDAEFVPINVIWLPQQSYGGIQIVRAKMDFLQCKDLPTWAQILLHAAEERNVELGHARGAEKTETTPTPRAVAA